MPDVNSCFPLLPYRVRNSGLSQAAVLAQSNKDCHAAGKQFDLNPLFYYKEALQAVIDLNLYDIRPMCNFMEPASAGKSVLGLRHDVDHDIVVARAMSRIESEFGLRGSYYLLHSHPFVTPAYYAQYDAASATVLRNNCLAEVYLEMQANGSEIGLHADAARLYDHHIDGMAAVSTELSWLREQGLAISGFSAHGSAPFYQVENFEFFREYLTGHFLQVTIQGRSIPLGQLSAHALGLAYEANWAAAQKADGAAIRNWLQNAKSDDVTEHLRLYLHDNIYCRWGADITCWLLGNDRWAVSGRDQHDVWLPKATLQDVLAVMATAPVGARIVWHVHPFYAGLRKSAHEQP